MLSKTAKVIESVLQSESWEGEWLDQLQAFKVSFSLSDRGIVDGLFMTVEEIEQFVFYVLVNLEIEDVLIAKVSEYLMRVNYGLRLGNFEMQMDVGTIRFKNGLYFGSEILTKNLVLNTVFPALEAVYRYLPGLYAVVENRLSPVEALAHAEGDASSGS